MAAAIEDIRRNYAGLYGVEELSERLGVSKSHLVRAFTAALGVSPGRYLTNVRIEAAMRLLLHREYTLDVIASLCGFSGPTTSAASSKNDRPFSHAVAGDGRSERTARAFARAAAVGTGIVYLVRFFRFSRKRVRQAVMASEAGNAAQTPFIPKRALSTREQATMATMPRESDVAEASAGRSTAPR